MKMNKMLTKKLQKQSSKTIAVFLAMSILFQCIAPTCAYALTGGPSQPEVQSFEPVGTSEMVDLFSGDFNYNIPLLDVDGYPINISYHSGITMDQEASWTGLGWNINAGVINRGMRGIPDDFNGENITKELNVKENKTYGFNTGAGIELFGLEKLHLGLNYSVGIKYNNYTGISADQSVNISLSSSKSPLTGSLGINSSSEEGLSLQPQIGLSVSTGKNKEGEQTGLSLSVGSAFNSRAGLKALTIGVSQNASVSSGKALKYGYESASKSAGGSVASSSFNFGMPTYTPQAGLPMQNLSVTGSFKLGLEGFGLHPNFTVGGYYNCQKLATHKIENPAFGYMNSDEGTKYDNAIMDFNREKDGSFTPSTPALPVTNFTYDIYSVSGQGVGGSYRPFRSDMGHVFDPETNTTSDGYSIGAEVGLANVFHVGADVAVNNTDATTGRWKDGNYAASKLTHRDSIDNDPFYEKYYFKEANEKSVDEDTAFFTKVGKGNLQSIALKQISKFNTVADNIFAEGKRPIPEENYRKKRQRRNQPLSIITMAESADYGLNDQPNRYAFANKDHIAEITTLKNDGSRYVYGLAAYNTTQEEVSFAVGKTLQGTGGRTNNNLTGLVTYVPGTDDSDGNTNGIDNYYSNTIMPAYAHSYMLTAVLSPDYVDSDYRSFDPTTKGPTTGDIGNYTKFSYTKVPNYQWRVPVGENQATFNEGLKSDLTDDKANYLYGRKDLLYLSRIDTKNYVAIFDLGDRKDGFGVEDKKGKRATANPMRYLKKISLYSRIDYETNPSRVPIKEVYFEYDYSLCPKVPNNINSSAASGNGKLTLKKIYFTYQKSNKGRLSPYTFNYSKFNPEYNIKAYDRWGNYKPLVVNGMPTSEYPYVEQDKTTADQYSQAWSLTEIILPSGGKVRVDYESDDYGYVQDKQAGQMFKVIGAANFTTTTFPDSGLDYPQDLNNSSGGVRLIVKLQETITGATPAIKDGIFQKQYLGGLDYLYFRFLMDIKGGRNEYVSGYLTKNDIVLGECKVSDDGKYASIGIKSTFANDNNTGSAVCPITKAAIQFGRLNMTRTVYSSVDVDNTMSNGQFGKDLLIALINASFTKTIAEAIAGPNQSLYSKGVGANAIMGKSFLRLNNPTKRKLGGGSRVKKIAISDEWNGEGIFENTGFSYGQEYLYTLSDGTSSGVAAYEPQLGGDENPWKQPVFFNTERLLAPDDKHYMEEPFGECFFPSPSVGYSRVIVQNIKRTRVIHNATGQTVHEFYTSKDYPTIAQRTNVDPKREKNNPLSLGSLFKLKVQDYMTATQGYVIELNDMNGKPKKQQVYQQGQTTPITSVEYYYQSDPYLVDKFRLNNTATVINSNGTINDKAQLGVFFDFVSDMREAKNEVTSGSFNFNTDGFIIPPFPVIIPIPIGLPSYANEKTQFRSAVVTKVIQRFGILSRTVAKDLGSVVETKNLAYDAETGDVLLTETTTDYNDKVYALTYPAYWYYNGMGPAYKNLGFKNGNITFNNGVASVPNALSYFAEGDEISIEGGYKGWITVVEPAKVQAMDWLGYPVNGKFQKILRSGRRNQQSVPMASITTLSNPLTALESNAYDQILQAQSMEYTNSWKTFCDCFTFYYENRGLYKITNPYVLGTKGMYKNKKSYLYLADRTQSIYDKNTNTRKDGVYTSYTPFYRINGGKWDMDRRNWTYTSEVTEFSPFGAELENKDALGRYSAAQYGYNQTLPVAVAANAKYGAIGVDNFEDYNFRSCADNHFKFYDGIITQEQAHSGKSSIRVVNGSPVSLVKLLQKCPAPGCNISLLTRIDAANRQYTLIISGGTAPYTFEWGSNNCDLPVKIEDNGTLITVNQLTTDCAINLTVTDKNNCKQVFQNIPINHY